MVSVCWTARRQRASCAHPPLGSEPVEYAGLRDSLGDLLRRPGRVKALKLLISHTVVKKLLNDGDVSACTALWCTIAALSGLRLSIPLLLSVTLLLPVRGLAIALLRLLSRVSTVLRLRRSAVARGRLLKRACHVRQHVRTGLVAHAYKRKRDAERNSRRRKQSERLVQSSRNQRSSLQPHHQVQHRAAAVEADRTERAAAGRIAPAEAAAVRIRLPGQGAADLHFLLRTGSWPVL